MFAALIVSQGARADLIVDPGFLQQATPPTSIAVQMGVSQQAGFRVVSGMPEVIRTNPPLSNLVGNLAGFDIVINAGPTLSLPANAQALAAFERAAVAWEDHISDPITVTIDADLAPLTPGVLGSTLSVTIAAPYGLIAGGIGTATMVGDAADESDDGIVASLPGIGALNGFVPLGFALDGNMTATKANLKAMGVPGLDIPAFGGLTDATITFSTGFTYDFDRSDGISALAFDFEGIAAHEIGHALGFVSDLDIVEFLQGGGTLNGSGGRQDTDVWPTPLDLFRFPDGTANDPTNAATFTTASRSFVPGSTDTWDQIDDSFGGDTEVLMSTGVVFGDGRQASHWKDNLGLGLLDPTLAPGEIAFNPTANDLRSLDLIGYEITVVPEPGSFVFLGLVGLLGGISRFIRRFRRG